MWSVSRSGRVRGALRATVYHGGAQLRARIRTTRGEADRTNKVGKAHGQTKKRGGHGVVKTWPVPPTSMGTGGLHRSTATEARFRFKFIGGGANGGFTC